MREKTKTWLSIGGAVALTAGIITTAVVATAQTGVDSSDKETSIARETDNDPILKPSVTSEPTQAPEAETEQPATEPVAPAPQQEAPVTESEPAPAPPPPPAAPQWPTYTPKAVQPSGLPAGWLQMEVGNGSPTYYRGCGPTDTFCEVTNGWPSQ